MTTHILIQLLINGLIAGFILAPFTLGLSLIFNTTKTFHFAHAAAYTAIAYSFYFLNVTLKIPLVIAAVLSVLTAVGYGCLIEHFLYQFLEKRGSSASVKMISSLGLYTLTVNSLGLIFGDESRILSTQTQQTISIGSVNVTQIQLLNAVISIFVSVIILLLLRETRLDMLCRAMRDDQQLLKTMGVSVTRLRYAVFAIGTALAGVTAVCHSLETGIDPHIGMSVFLIAAVAMFIGGVSIFHGAFWGAILLSLAQSVSLIFLSANWRELVIFLGLIVFLMFKPEGVFTSRRRVEEVG